MASPWTARGGLCHRVDLSSDFPTTPGPSTRGSTEHDVFVVKLNAAGSALVYATFLGGSTDDGYDIAVDGSGAAYVTGTT